MAKPLPLPVEKWFESWNAGSIDELPITDDFRHTSPFGVIEPKRRYLEIVNRNRQAFLGNTLTVVKHIVEGDRACVQFRQTRQDDPDFDMIVCEWYVIDGDRIREIESFYNIGDAVIQG